MNKEIKRAQLIGSKRVLFPLILVVICLLTLMLVWSASVVVRGFALYEQINYHSLWQMNYSRTAGIMWKMDPVFGYRFRPGASGRMLIPLGGGAPFYQDSDGLRVPQGVTQAFDPERHPSLLFIGDSFTYGQLVAVKKTFPSLVGEQLQAQILNAGTPGYGLAQMTLQARALIPKYRPDLVVVQYSPWLASRATSIFATSTKGAVPAPYYYKVGDKAEVALPAFTAPDSTMEKVEHYKWQPLDVKHKLQFVVAAAFPFYLRYDAGMAVFRLKQWLGLAPEPTGDLVAIVTSAYGEIGQIAREHHTKLVILVLGSASDLAMPPASSLPSDAIVVNAWQEMVKRLPDDTREAYAVAYYHWNGNPRRLVDWHPTELAHKIIAQTLAAAIKKNQLMGF